MEVRAMATRERTSSIDSIHQMSMDAKYEMA